MRSVRLLGIILQLSRVTSTSVSALAQRFDVSERTLQRDLNAIADLGVPIWTRTGPAGGVGIVEGWRSPITGMTGPEVQALMIGSAGSHELGLAEAYGSARIKMLDARAVGHHAESVDERFFNDNEQWFTTAERPYTLPVVAEAVWASRRLSIQYARHNAQPKQRLVDPLGLVLKTDRWYLVASHRQKPLAYRVSRIVNAELVDEPAKRPNNFSLADYWHEFSSAFEASLHTVPVVFSIPESSIDALLVHVPGAAARRALEAASAVNQRLHIELMMESIDIAVSQLIAVPGVAVEHPMELRQALHARANEIAQRNAE